MAGAPAFGMADSLSGARRRPALHRLQHRLRALAAVRAHHGDVPVLEGTHDVLRLVAVERGPLFREGHRHRDGQRAHGADGGDGGPGLVESGDGLDREEVHAAFGQAFRLLAVGGHGLVEGDVAERLQRLSQRPIEPATRPGWAASRPRARPRG
jgi:hypothetical protein